MEIMIKADENSSPIWFGHFRLSFSEKIIKSYNRLLIFQSFNGAILVGSAFCFLVAFAFALLFFFPRFQLVFNGFEVPINNDSVVGINKTFASCNVFEGSWIKDQSYPLYDGSQCPFIEQGFNCLANGRKDGGFLKWRWKPKNCEIPRLDVREVLEKLRGKRIVFVGDSLSRTQWESLICILLTGVEDKKSVFEVNNNTITKQSRFLEVMFSSFNLKIDYYRSVFLVQSTGVTSKNFPKKVKSIIELEKMDDISKEWIDSDVLIFNSGNWWTPRKLFQKGNYFQIGGSLKLEMSAADGFKMALKTWASWAQTDINPNKTSVFFRTFESSHWSRSRNGSCKVTKQPSTRTEGRDKSLISSTIFEVVKNMSLPVTILYVTPMGAYRSDGHVGQWSGKPLARDCTHWCLPGVPETWNEILLSYLMFYNEAN